MGMMDDTLDHHWNIIIVSNVMYHLPYFIQKEIVDYCNNNNHQTIVHGGANYDNRKMKRL